MDIPTKNFTFSKNLKYLRKKRGISQLDLALELGVSRGAVGNYEIGFPPRSKELQKIPSFFEVTMDELLNIPIEPVDTLIDRVSENEHFSIGTRNRVTIEVSDKCKNTQNSTKTKHC